jgi:hypothetical protein
MCIVVDMNTIAAVFDPANKAHNEFQPVEEWLRKGKGKFVYGGTTYNKELRKLVKYLPLVLELQRQSKTVKCSDTVVDAKEDLIKKDLLERGILVTDKRYNDAHIVAIVSTSKVKLVSSLDKSSYRFLREAAYYSSPSDRPVIYSSKRNENLLTHPKYYGKCCTK